MTTILLLANTAAITTTCDFWTAVYFDPSEESNWMTLVPRWGILVTTSVHSVRPMALDTLQHTHLLIADSKACSVGVKYFV